MRKQTQRVVRTFDWLITMSPLAACPPFVAPKASIIGSENSQTMRVLDELFQRQFRGHVDIRRTYEEVPLALKDSMHSRYQQIRVLVHDMRLAFQHTEITERMSTLKTLERITEEPKDMAKSGIQAFFMFGGATVLFDILEAEMRKPDPLARPQRNYTANQQARFLNLFLSVLREVCYILGDVARCICDEDDVLMFLFKCLRSAQLFDSSLGMLEEVLSVRVEPFDLTKIGL